MTLSNLHAAFLALALAGAAAPAMAQSFIPLRDAVPSIAVTGEAGAEIVPDLAILTFAVVSEKKTPAEASASWRPVPLAAAPRTATAAPSRPAMHRRWPPPA